MGKRATKKKRKKKGSKRTPRGKAKGSDFEREMCKRLSLWWTDGDSDQVFWRNSGFLARGPKGCVEHQYGDMHAIGERGQLFVKRVNVEFKFYKDLRLLDIVDKPGKKHVTLLDHWRQCVRDAEKSSREPMLVAKRNFAEPFVVCHHDLAHRLVEDGDLIEFYGGDNYLCAFALRAFEEHNDADGFLTELAQLEMGRDVGEEAPNVRA